MTYMINMRVLDDLRTDLVNVWAYKTPTAGAWPAERVPVNVGIDSIMAKVQRSAKLSTRSMTRGSCCRYF